MFADHWPLKDLLQYNAFCRAHNIKFIAAHLAGLTASIFVDFGNAHRCFDADGALERNVIVDHISNAKHGVVTIDGERHLLHDGELVKLEGVYGMQPVDPAVAAKVAEQRKAEEHANPDKQQFVKVTDTVYNIHDTFEVKCLKVKDKDGRESEVKNKFLIGDTTQLKPYLNGQSRFGSFAATPHAPTPRPLSVLRLIRCDICVGCRWYRYSGETAQSVCAQIDARQCAKSPL